MTTGRLKLLHVIDQGGPGGAQVVFAQIILGLSDRGFDNAAVVNCDGWLSARLRSETVQPYIVGGKGSINVGYLRSLIRIIRIERPNLVVAHLLGPGVYCSMAGLWTRTPVVTVFHGQSDVTHNERLLSVKSAFIRLGSRRVVFVSDKLLEALGPRLGVTRDFGSVITNGVNIERITSAPAASLREELGLDASAFLIGAIGHLRPEKRYDVLLRAARLAIDSEPRLRFVIAGDIDTPLFDELWRIHSELGLGRYVHFLGLRADVPNVIKALDAYVLCSASEGFSIACCEAMAGGVPVVATRSGGPEQILDEGRCGILAPVGDPLALAEAMIAAFSIG